MRVQMMKGPPTKPFVLSINGKNSKTGDSREASRKQEQMQAYGGLVLGGAVVLLWIGMVMAMNATHNNLRPVFIVLGVVITLGLGYAYYDTVHPSPEEDERERLVFIGTRLVTTAPVGAFTKT